MSNLDTLMQDLVVANRILAEEDVVDAYGHVSLRNPDDAGAFFSGAVGIAGIGGTR